MKIIANTPPKVVDAVTAVEAVADKLIAILPGAQPAQKSEAVVSSPVVPVVPAAPKVSLIKHIGHFLASIGRIFVKDVAPAEPTIVAALETLLPQFTPALMVADGIFTKITKQILVTQTSAALVKTPPTGESKLQAVTDAISAELDQYMQNLFPGSKQVDAAEKSGLVQAIFNIVNKQAPAVTIVAPPAA